MVISATAMQASHTEFPALKQTIKLGGKDNSDNGPPWYDVKFYPYTPPGVDPVFAAVGGPHVAICRCVQQKDNYIDILHWFTDEELEASPPELLLQFHSVEWAQAENGDPLVCVTGKSPKIKVLNAITGKLVTTLVGHGNSINDMKISPLNPRLLATCSDDKAIRLWSLNKEHRKDPTAVIFAGEGGHAEAVLTIAFHSNGRYLLSGGMDTNILMWVVPEDPEQNAGHDKPMKVQFPHFASTDIHPDFIDSACFFNDLILSRASKQNSIHLWKIENFDSNRPVPDYREVPILTVPIAPQKENPKVYHDIYEAFSTRSAWGGKVTRLLQFDQPNSELFYLRFSVFHELGKHPILAAGNAKWRVFFWDLQKLEEGGVEALIAEAEREKDRNKHAQSVVGGKDTAPEKDQEDANGDENADAQAPTAGLSTAALGHALSVAPQAPTTRTGRLRESSVLSNASSRTTPFGGVPRGALKKKPDVAAERGIGDPFYPLPAHRSVVVVKGGNWKAVRQVAWSRGGEWCVAVGDNGLLAVLGR